MAAAATDVNRIFPNRPGFLQKRSVANRACAASSAIKVTAVTATAARLRCTPAQVALAWLLDLRPEVLLISGTSSISHLEENMAVVDIGLDSEARDLLGSDLH